MSTAQRLMLHRLWREVKESLRPIVDLVYPPRCPSCGAATANHGALCSDCWGKLEFSSDREPFSSDGNMRHTGIISATSYNDVSRDLILKFKHGGKIALAPLLGRMIASRIDTEQGDQPLLIPVPLHRTRIWRRGFNQAALLAYHIAKAGKGDLLVDGLFRRKRTPSLGTRSATEREAILHNAIGVRPGASELVRARHIILVDDVLTSGATSNACAEALLKEGAASVRIACFARADYS